MTDLAPVEMAPPGDTPDGGFADTPALAGGADPGRLAGVTAIWIRELRGRMRGKRAFIFITIYLLILVGLFWAALEASRDFWTQGAVETSNFGRGIFGAVMYVETLVIIALAPAYTAGLISQEREKQTFDLLSVTPISSVAIVLGKLFSGLSYLALVVGASIPLASAAFVFGGVDITDLVRGYTVLIVSGIGIGTLGVWCSAAMKRTQAATVSAYVITALLVLGASGSWIILATRFDDAGAPGRPPEALLYLNPFAAVSDVICEATGGGCIVAEAIARTSNPASQQPQVDLGQAPIGPGVQFNPEPLPPIVYGGTFWPKTVLAYLLLTPIAFFAAAQSLSPTRRWRWPGRNRRQAFSGESTDD